MAGIKTPTSPLDANAWRASPPAAGGMPFWKYQYAQSGPETFATVAAKFAGAMVTDKSMTVPSTLTWNTITQFNYGTDDPGEINWYLQNFNGCTKKNAAGDFVFDAADPSPFIYVPGTGLTASSNVVVPPDDKKSVIVLAPPASEFTRIARSRFNEIDFMRTGFLRKSDIVSKLTSKTFTGTAAAMLGTLWNQFSSMEDFSDDELGPETSGVTRADLAALDRLLATKATDAAQAVVNTFLYMKTKITGAGSALYATDPIDPMKVCQGLVGDCWFLAALVALKDRANAAVRGMIQDKGATLIVTFPGDASSPITLPRPNDVQIAVVAASHGNGLWLTVLELALGFRKNSSNPLDGVDTGGRPGDGIELLTNNSTDVDFLSLHKDDTTRNKLDNALTNKKAIVASIRGNFDFWNDGVRNGWPMGHAYSVLAFDRKADTVNVRNPWGDGSAGWTLDGRTIKLTDFFGNWSEIAYEE